MPNINRRIVVGLVGPIGAGKTIAAVNLSDGLGFQYLRYSQILAEWFPERHRRDGTLQTVGWEIMTSRQEELNRRLVAKASSTRDIAIDGLRHPIDEECLRRKFRKAFFMIYLDAPAKIRWHRKSIQSGILERWQFDRADSHPVEQPLRLLAKNADFTLQNRGSIEEHLKKVQSIVEYLRRTRDIL